MPCTDKTYVVTGVGLGKRVAPVRRVYSFQSIAKRKNIEKTNGIRSAAGTAHRGGRLFVRVNPMSPRVGW